jgi:hypothetical protein
MLRIPAAFFCSRSWQPLSSELRVRLLSDGQSILLGIPVLYFCNFETIDLLDEFPTLLSTDELAFLWKLMACLLLFENSSELREELPGKTVSSVLLVGPNFVTLPDDSFGLHESPLGQTIPVLHRVFSFRLLLAVEEQRLLFRSLGFIGLFETFRYSVPRSESTLTKSYPSDKPGHDSCESDWVFKKVSLKIPSFFRKSSKHSFKQ